MGLPGEKPYDIAKDPQLLRETRKAAEETGIWIHDTENARIVDGVDVSDYEPSLAAAAELGIRHILSNIWTGNKAFYTEQFMKLCDLAAQYDQTVSVEFVTWASVRNLEEVKELQNATLSMKDSMEKMRKDAGLINESGTALTEVSSKMKESINDIALQIDQFQI